MISASEKKTAMGGTELMAARLEQYLTDGCIDDFQIVLSRVRELDPDKFRIFWAHDLPGDPESEFLKDPILRDRFHHFVFVSNWQFWMYAQTYALPLDRCSVIPNAIWPVRGHKKPDHNEQIRLIYFSTPHRGLDILVPAFEDIYNRYGNKVHLDVYSSFSLYGWSDRDVPYESLFERCRNHPGITYHGAVGNDEIRKALTNSHILAYPSTWPETSCLVLIEAMSAGLDCVHSNLAALPETSAGLTAQYTYQADPTAHQKIFTEKLSQAILDYEGPCTYSSEHVMLVHDWNRVSWKWDLLMQEIRERNPSKALEDTGFFTLKVN